MILSTYLITASGNDSYYYCETSNGGLCASCYESIENRVLDAIISDDLLGFFLDDGGCCEDSSQNPVCCIIRVNRAFSLK